MGSMFIRSLEQDVVNENIQLKQILVKEYQEEHLKPTTGLNNGMRRLICTIEQLDFEEVRYTLDTQYINNKYPELGIISIHICIFSNLYPYTLGSIFRFFKFPFHGKGLPILVVVQYPDTPM